MITHIHSQHCFSPCCILLVFWGGPAALQDMILQLPVPIPAHRGINYTDISAQPFFHSWYFYDEINRSHSALTHSTSNSSFELTNLLFLLTENNHHFWSYTARSYLEQGRAVSTIQIPSKQHTGTRETPLGWVSMPAASSGLMLLTTEGPLPKLH